MQLTKKNIQIIGVSTVILIFVTIFALFLNTDPLLRYIKKNNKWTPVEFNSFIDHCNGYQLDTLSQALKKEFGSEFMPKSNQISAIKKEFLWQASNLFSYAFKNSGEIDYHYTVKWVARKCEIPQEVVENAPTFHLERRIMEYSFKDVWDKLTKEQRIQLINKIDTKKKINASEVSVLGGTAALTSLASTVYFTGFAFYTTMSTVVSASAGFVGITLPFSAYTGLSSTVAFLSGPVGWTLVAIGAGGSIAIAGKANWRKCMAFIIQMHCIKVDVIQKSKFRLFYQ